MFRLYPISLISVRWLYTKRFPFWKTLSNSIFLGGFLKLISFFCSLNLLWELALGYNLRNGAYYTPGFDIFTNLSKNIYSIKHKKTHLYSNSFSMYPIYTRIIVPVKSPHKRSVSVKSLKTCQSK